MRIIQKYFQNFEKELRLIIEMCTVPIAKRKPDLPFLNKSL